MRIIRTEQAREALRERDRLKKQRRRAKRKAVLLDELNFSKTSPQYRRLLGPAPEMTKTQLRALLAQAVRNTREAA